MEEYSLTTGKGSKRHVTLPKQTYSTSKKLSDKRWQEDTIDYFVHNSYNTNSRRKSLEDMAHNRAVMASIMDSYALQESLDPLGVIEESTNIDMPFKFYNIIEQPFNALLGEELKRNPDIKAFVVNSSAINEKDEMFKKRLSEYLMQKSQSESVSEAEIKEDMQKLENWRRNDLQTAHEQMANEILQAAIHDTDLNLKGKFNEGFQDLQVIAEEIYHVEENGRKVDVRVIDGEHFWVHGIGDSLRIEDASAWMYMEWMSPNSIVAEFADELTKAEVDDLFYKKLGSDSMFVPSPIASAVEVTRNNLPEVSAPLTIEEVRDSILTDKTGLSDSHWTDQYGNVRVIRIQWISLRRVGELKYYDQFGDEQYIFVDENYKPVVERGEEVRWFYVEELWRGCLIGNDMYKRVGIHPVQMRDSMNPYKVRPTFIGAIKAYNGTTARSRLDTVLEYQNMFNIYMNKLVELWTNNLGKAAIIDVSRIPKDMDKTEWFTWLKRFRLVYENPFEEVKHRPDLVPGSYQQGNRVLDLSLANEIQQAIEVLSWIEQKIDKITAVPAPRQGDLTGREGLGTSQQAILQSSNQTEVDFNLHEYVKARVLETYLEYTKQLYKDYKGQMQYLLSDLSAYIINIDGALLNEAEYGIRITNTGKAVEMDTIFKQLIHPAIQAGTLTMSDAGAALIAGSPSEKVNILKEAEDKRFKQSQEAEQAKIQAAQQNLQMQMQFEQIKLQGELAKIDRKGEWDLRLKQLELQDKALSDVFNSEGEDDNRDGVEDQIELDKANIAKETKMLELKSKEKIEFAKIKSQEKLKSEELKSKEAIEKTKAKQAKAKKAI